MFCLGLCYATPLTPPPAAPESHASSLPRFLPQTSLNGRSKQVRPTEYPPPLNVVAAREAAMAERPKPFSAAVRVRDAKTRDTRHANIELCVGLCADFSEAARVLALSAMDPATPHEGALRALALLLRNWERLLAEAPKAGGGGVNPHRWLEARQKQLQNRRYNYRCVMSPRALPPIEPRRCASHALFLHPALLPPRAR